MLKHYLTVAFRHILRHTVYSVINIAGLAVGMACTVLILMWVQHEFSFDHYHENVDKIYRLASNWDLGKWQGLYAISNHAVGPTMQKDYPEIVKTCRFRPIPSGAVTQYKNKKFREEEIFYADNSVFDIFSFPLLKGKPSEVLQTANSIVLSKSMVFAPTTDVRIV